MPFNYVPVNGGEATGAAPLDVAKWQSDAAVYQWDDDFGDVGEPNPLLEKELFEDVDLQRAGTAIKALSYDVTTEGPEKVQPVRDVSCATYLLDLPVHSCIVRRRRSSSSYAGECQTLPI